MLLTRSPSDVAMLVTGQGSPPGLSLERPVLVPFGGAEHDWAAAEIGAWLAAATGSALQLAGTAADEASGRRDASKLLASASFAIQRALSIQTEPAARRARASRRRRGSRERIGARARPLQQLVDRRTG